MATHSNVLAGRIPWIKGPGGLHTVHMGPQRAGHDLACACVSTHPPTHTHTPLRWMIQSLRAGRLPEARSQSGCLNTFSNLPVPPTQELVKQVSPNDVGLPRKPQSLGKRAFEFRPGFCCHRSRLDRWAPAASSHLDFTSGTKQCSKPTALLWCGLSKASQVNLILSPILLMIKEIT